MNFIKSRAGLLRRLAAHQANLAQLILDIEAWDLAARRCKEPPLADQLPGLLEQELELVRMLEASRAAARVERLTSARRNRLESRHEAPFHHGLTSGVDRRSR